MVRTVMADGDTFPEDYDVWLRSFEAVVRTEKLRDSVVLKSMIDPVAFMIWCTTTDQRPNADARTRHLNRIIDEVCAGCCSPDMVESYQLP
jgi:hypothetical protein